MVRILIAMAAGFVALSVSAVAQPLADQNFEVTRLYGKSVTYDHSPSLAFGPDGSVRGHGGCNNYGGVYVAKAVTRTTRAKRGAKAKTVRVWTLRIRNISSTRMHCGPGSLVENRFFNALEAGRRYVLDGGTLTIYGARGRTPLIQLTKVAM